MDWGKGLKNIEISDRIKCDSDSEWDTEECVLFKGKQKGMPNKFTNENCG